MALHVERIVLRSRRIDITLRAGASPEGQGAANPGSLVSTTLHLPWTPTSASARKGIAWKPSAQSNLDPATSDLLLTAIARARSWMNDLSEGRVNSFEEIARSENKVERHIRRLAPLAFVSPRIVEAIANRCAPADLTVTSLTSALPRSRTKQEKRTATSADCASLAASNSTGRGSGSRNDADRPRARISCRNRRTTLLHLIQARGQFTNRG